MADRSSAENRGWPRADAHDDATRLGTPVRLPKAAELLAGQLRRQIVCGELPAGTALPPEAVLLDVFDVSRPTLREAFRILESERLLTVRRGARGGATVHVPDDQLAARFVGYVLEHQGASLADVYEARAVIEVDAVRTLARTRRKADVAALREALEPMDPLLQDVARFAAAAGTFHTVLVQRAGNTTLGVLDAVLNQIITRAGASFASRASSATRDTPRSQREHRAVVDLITARDADGAATLWRAHCDRVARIVLAGPGAKDVLDLLT